MIAIRSQPHREMPPQQIQLFSVGGARFAIHMTDQVINPKIKLSIAHLCQPRLLSLTSNDGLATVFYVSKDDCVTFNAEWFRHKIDFYQIHDDVFQNTFLPTIILHGIKDEDAEITEDGWEFLQTAGTTSIHYIPEPLLRGDIKPGPCAIVKGSLQEVWRLYEDTNGCFFTAVRPCQTRSVPFLHRQSIGTNDFEVLLFS